MFSVFWNILNGSGYQRCAKAEILANLMFLRWFILAFKHVVFPDSEVFDTFGPAQ